MASHSHSPGQILPILVTANPAADNTASAIGNCGMAGIPLKMHWLKADDDDPDPLALCCYGILRKDTHKVMIRFIEGRPEGGYTRYQSSLLFLCKIDFFLSQNYVGAQLPYYGYSYGAQLK
jgi:hypothetical protein